MPRTIPEWIGKTDDEPVPPRVRLRVLLTFNRVCNKCYRVIRPGVEWTCDHKIALINGGENRERNLQPLCDWCNPLKNKADVAEKSAVYDRAASHAGIKRKPKGRPMPGTKLSGWKHKVSGEWVRR